MSHVLGAPIIALPVFIALSVLEAAKPIHVAEAITFGTVLPLVGIAYIARLEGLDYDIPERKTRIKPFAVTIVSYVIGLVLLISSGAPLLVSGLMLAYSVNTSAMLLVTLFWKISIHAAGVTGPLTFLAYRLGYWWALLYLIVVPVGLLRFRLGKHTVPQIVAGAILSAALTWADIIWLVPLIRMI